MEFDFTQPVESLDKVPEQLRPIFKAGDDGKYVVDESFKGVATIVSGLNTSLKAARQEARSKAVDLSPLADFGSDPASIKAAIDAKIEELTKGKSGDVAKQIEAVKTSMAEGFSKEKTKLTARAEALQNQLYTLLVENNATAAIAELKGTPELLLPFVKTQVRVVEEDGNFKVQVVSPTGEVRYGPTGQPMTIKELVSEMKSQEKFGRLFDSETPAGNGSRPGQVQRPATPAGNANATPTGKIAAGLGARMRGHRR